MELDDVIKFTYEYKRLLGNNQGCLRPKLNKKLNENYEKYFTLTGKMKEVFDFQKTLTTGSPKHLGTTNTLKPKTNIECLRHLDRECISYMKVHKVDLDIFNLY